MDAQNDPAANQAPATDPAVLQFLEEARQRAAQEATSGTGTRREQLDAQRVTIESDLDFIDTQQRQLDEMYAQASEVLDQKRSESIERLNQVNDKLHELNSASGRKPQSALSGMFGSKSDRPRKQRQRGATSVRKPDDKGKTSWRGHGL